jgi:phosphohistidine phosphatase
MTARRFLLIRHAKAEDHGVTDARRSLARRGERDAAEIGKLLAYAGLVPDRAVVSPARRAVQTWEHAAAAAGGAPEAVEDERIYDNTVDDLLAVIRETPAEVVTLALVGHNPSVAALADELDDGTGDETARTEMTHSYPTSGVAVFEVAGPWSALAPGGATVRSFTAPRG